MELAVAAEHEVVTSFAHDVSRSFSPKDIELLRAFKHILGAIEGCQVDTLWDVAGPLIIVVVFSFQELHDLTILRRDGHWVMGVDGVVLEMIGKGSQEQLVEDASLLNVEVVLDTLISPVGQGLGMVVDCIESVASDQDDGIGKDCPGNGIRRTNTLEELESFVQTGIGDGSGTHNSRNHGHLVVFCDNSGIQFDKIWMLVKVPKLLGNIGIYVG